MEYQMEQEKKSDKITKFDFNKRKPMPLSQYIEPQVISKRKSSCPVSNEILQSPLKKELKNSQSQYPGYSYFTSLFSSRDTQKIEQVSGSGLITPYFNDSQIEDESEELGVLQLLEGSPIDSHAIEKSYRQTINKLGYKGIFCNRFIKDLVAQERERESEPNTLWSEGQKQILIWATNKILQKRNIDIELFNSIIWSDIASLFCRRSGKDCKRQWRSMKKLILSKAPWSNQEDLILTIIVQKYQSNSQDLNWMEISKELNAQDIQQRNEKSCRHRWFNHLDPKISRDAWGSDEDLNLLKLTLRLGKRWRQLQQEWKMPVKRTYKQMRLRLSVLMEKEKKFFTPTHCHPQSQREISQFQDSGYESDTSSCSSTVDVQLTGEDKRVINEIIRNIQDNLNHPLDHHKNQMHTEKDEQQLNIQKKKLMNFVHTDLQMSERNIKISHGINVNPIQQIKSFSNLQKMGLEIESQEEQTLKNTPLIMSNLSRTLSSMNITSSKVNLPTLNLRVEPSESLNLFDLQELQFSVVNYRTGVIHLLTSDQIQNIIKKQKDQLNQ